MRKSRDVHAVSWIASLIVAGSAFLTGLSGGLLPHIRACLLGNLQFGFILIVPETILVTVSTMLVVEALIRQWNRSRQFGLRDLFMLTTAVSVVLSLLVTEQRLAGQFGGLPAGLPWLAKFPAIFGIGCVVYCICWGIDYALHGLKSARKAARKRQGLDRQMPGWLSTPDMVLPSGDKKRRSIHHQRERSVDVGIWMGRSLSPEVLGSSSPIVPGFFALLALALVLKVVFAWLRQ